MQEVLTMNQLDERQLQVHVPIVGWALIISNALFLVLALFLWVLLAGVGIASGDPQARTILTIVGTAVAMLLSLLSIPGLAAGFGLLARKHWGRILGTVVSILGLLNFPLGTLIGVYALWVLFQDSAQAYFGAHQAAGQ
jgi:hypothetical protein